MIANTPAAWSARAAEVLDPAEAVRWSPDGQRDRHEAVLEALELQWGETLLDFGCGTGAFYECVPAGVIYTGYDWAPGMVARALTEHPGRLGASRSFTTEWPDTKFDAVAAIGPFNLPDSWSKRQTWDALDMLWDQTRRVLVASLYRGDNPDCLRYRPEEAERFVDRTRPAFACVDEYRDNDMLLALHR